MPHLWRARLTNIEYDAGKKIYSDELFRFNGRNTLINLANGGGKTLLIQLLLQVVLPNESLNKRPLADLLTGKKYTGHILVEWKLDTQEPAFLTTGFCFTRGNEEDERLKYFLYTLHYHVANDFDIKNMALVQDKTPLSYSELLNLLRGAPRSPETRISIYDRDDKRRAYLRDLESYGLFAQEWKNIKQTNNIEGGVGEFFAQAKTSRQLLDTILIPAVEEAIFNGEEDAKRLALAFQQVNESLIRLPELEKNLRDFQLLRTEGERVLTEVRRFAQNQATLREEKSRLRQLFNRVEQEWETVGQDLGQIEEALAGKKNERQRLLYLAESIPYVRLVREKEAAEREHRQAQEQLRSLREREAEADFRWRQSRGVNFYLERAALLAANQGYEKQRDLLALGREDKLLELDRARATFRAVLTVLRTEIQEEYDCLKTDNTILLRREQALKKELEGLRQTDKDLAGRIASLAAVLERYQKTWDELAQVYQNIGWLEVPEQALKDLSTDLACIRNTLQGLEEKRSTLLSEQKEREESLKTLILTISEREYRLSDLQKEKEASERATANLQEALGRFSIHCVHPQAEHSRIEAEIISKKMAFRDRIRLEGVRLEEDKSQLSLLRDTDSYVPNREILKVQKLLEELRIPAQTGSKWLEEQGEEADREAYLRHQPLLPYGLVLAEEDFKRLENSNTWQSELLNSPVPLLARRPALVPAEESTLSKILPIGGPAYLLWHKGYRYALSGESRREWAHDLETEIERKTEILGNLQVTEDQLVTLQEQADGYFRLYPPGYLPSLAAQIDQAEEALALARSENEKLMAEKAEAERESKETRSRLEEKRKAENARERDLERFRAWQQDFLDRRQKYSEHNQALLDQQRLAYELRQKESEQEQTREEHLNGERKLKDLESLKQRREEELNSVPVPSRQVLPEHEMSYEEAKALWEVSEKAFAQAHSELRHWEENIRRNREDSEKLLKRLVRELKLELTDVEEAKYPITEEEIDRQEAEVLKLKEETGAWLERVNAAEKVIERLLGQLSEKEARIRQTYGREPALAFEDLEGEAARIAREIDALKSQVEEWNQIAADTLKRKTMLTRALDSLAAGLKNFEVPPSEEILAEADWQAARDKLAATIEAWSKLLQSTQKDSQRLREAVEKAFRHYAQVLRDQGNTVIDRFVSHLVADEERHFQLEAVEQSFAKSFEIIAQYEEKAAFEMKEAERNKLELVQRSIKQVERVAQEMQMIDRYVKVDYAGRRVNAVQIKLKEIEADKAPALMEAYIDDLIKELKRLAQEGETEEKQEKFIERKMSSRQLLNVLSALDQASVRVLKPEQHPTGPYFSAWEEVQKWSGGERYAGYMAMFMAILCYTRSKMSSLHNPPKVMLADNPFGIASSPHVLNLIFQLAENNKVQMICLTALSEDAIFAYFPTVYSLRLRPFAGNDYMTSKIERGSYHIDSLEEELKKKRQVEFDW
ncbi:hypothetical protein CEB3_c36200 [Peptococcaceae bacterium CEB3]|nr:hypothetical protein CEB3_c36200 [Peptococcaceae bacterium CEB3]